MAEPAREQLDRIGLATTADVPHLSANGLAIGLGTGDIVIALEQNGRPIATLNCSFTVAKTIATLLGNVIADLEAMSGRPIMTTVEIDKMLHERNAALVASQSVEKSKARTSKAKRKPH